MIINNIYKKHVDDDESDTLLIVKPSKPRVCVYNNRVTHINIVCLLTG